MMPNRSMPDDVVIPVLAYPDVNEAVGWLEEAFGFRRRWIVGEHRAQLAVGGSAAVAVTRGTPSTGGNDHVMVRVEDIDAHRDRARSAGAEVGKVGQFPYGERQYTATDLVGRTWVFTQTVADVAPGDWGAS